MAEAELEVQKDSREIQLNRCQYFFVTCPVMAIMSGTYFFVGCCSNFIIPTCDRS